MKPPYYFNTAAKHIADKTNNTTAVIARITPATLFFSIKRLADVNALTRQPARNINGNIIPLLLLQLLDDQLTQCMPLERCHLHGNHILRYGCNHLHVEQNVDLIH